jgi:hypothetical protein|tara:strand:+ start:473 stop:1138 length:666 start_codon:yes stop_codon:yes gene_type:complete
MNLSSDTVAVLKNFSDINQNILVKTGNKLQTISTMKNILAEAEISEKFESEFAIYDLPEFLRAVELFEKPELKFNGGSNLQIADANSKQAIKYFFADKSVITCPTKNITMPDKEVTFTLTKDAFAQLLKGVTTLNLPDVAVVGDGKNIKLVATDKKNKSSNNYSVNVGETTKTFSAYFKAENFKMVNDDYDVAISKQKISHFINRSKPIQYWIALEPDSEI